MDFMHDILADGSKIRLLTTVDMFSRESIAVEVDYGFKSNPGLLKSSDTQLHSAAHPSASIVTMVPSLFPYTWINRPTGRT